MQGCTACARDYTPVAELCDNVDNDCSGETDEGNPPDMGATRPDFAARLSDVSQPNSLAPGEAGEAWATFVNEGASTWPAGEVWLASLSAGKPGGSPLYDEDSWPAYDVAAVLDREVPPGQSAFFSWTVRAPEDETAVSSDSFRLMDPAGAMMRCPVPQVDVSIRASTRGATLPTAPAGSPDTTAGMSDGCACRAGTTGRTSWYLGWLTILARY